MHNVYIGVWYQIGTCISYSVTFFVFVKSLKNYFPQKWGVYWAKPKSGVKTKICHNYDYYN